MISQDELFQEVRGVRARVDDIHNLLSTKADREELKHVEERVRNTEAVAHTATTMGRVTISLLGILASGGVIAAIVKFFIGR